MTRGLVTETEQSEKPRIRFSWDPAQIRWLLRSLAFLAAVAQAFVARNSINSDGRSYLEVAHAYLRHDWGMAVNSYWGPLYSWILMPLLRFARPSLRYEYPLIHLLNLVLFVICAIAFEFFWTSLLAYRKSRQSSTPRLMSESPLWIFGYTWFTLLMCGLLPFVNPDLTLAILVFAATGTLLQILLSDAAPRYFYVGMGLMLGLGYLAKAVMFPMAFVFLGILVLHRKSRNMTRIALAFVVFLGVCLPEIVWLSTAKGHPTFSGTGKLAYAWYTYDLPILHWQGQPPSSGVPAHPTRKIYSNPDVFEFNGPIRSNYPPWYDPSYWNEGMSPRFQFAVVVKHFAQELFLSLPMVCTPRFLILGVFLLLLLSDPIGTIKNMVFYWPLLIVMAAIFVLYSLTLALPRYYAPWQMLLWGAVLCSIQFRDRFLLSGYYRWIAVGAAVLTFASQAKWTNWQLNHAREDDAVGEYAMVEGLKKLGLNGGQNVGSIGFDEVAQWAYLDQLYIVAEINSWNACEFWQSSPAVQSEVLEKFKESGAEAIVANTGGGMLIRTRSGSPIDQGACARPGAGWQKIEGSANHIYLLR